MANRALFKGAPGAKPRPADKVNEAGGHAYDPGAKHSLAQYAMTGTFSDAFYTTAEEQLATVLELSTKVDSEYIAKLAVYARDKGQMKDMPAFLCAVLAARKDPEARQLLAQVFPKVMTNTKMLRNFVQVVRSGAVGRKSFGTSARKLVASWITSRTADAIFRDSIGQKPSLGDVIALSHPKPSNDEQRALFGYLRGLMDATKKDGTTKLVDAEKLPALVKSYEAWKKDAAQPMPDLPFQMLTSSELSDAHWKTIAERANWHTLRMNLNTFERHGVFKDKALVKKLAAKLRDKDVLSKVRVFPYQLYTAYKYASAVDEVLRNALQDALDFVVGNVPVLEGNVVVAIDVSSSMQDPATGHRTGATSVMTCVEVASLFASCILRTNPNVQVIAFDTSPYRMKLNPRDAVITNAEKISNVGGGGTDCSVALDAITGPVDLVVMISDNQSWVQNGEASPKGAQAWTRLRKKNPQAKLVCHDIQPYGDVQMYDVERQVMNIGGLGEHMFDQIRAFVAGEGPGNWVKEIENTTI